MGLFPDSPSGSSLLCVEVQPVFPPRLCPATSLQLLVLMLLLWSLWGLWRGCRLHTVCCTSVPMQMPSRVCFLPVRSGQNLRYLGVSLSHVLLSTHMGTRLLSPDGVLALCGTEPPTHSREVLVPVPRSPRGPALRHVSRGSV